MAKEEDGIINNGEEGSGEEIPRIMMTDGEAVDDGEEAAGEEEEEEDGDGDNLQSLVQILPPAPIKSRQLNVLIFQFSFFILPRLYGCGARVKIDPQSTGVRPIYCFSS